MRLHQEVQEASTLQYINRQPFYFPKRMKYTLLLTLAVAQTTPFCDSFPAATPLETVTPGAADQTAGVPAAGDGTILSGATINGIFVAGAVVLAALL